MPARVGEERFVELVREALALLPSEFHRYLQGLEVRVEDYPDDEQMREWGMKPPHYPFGVYAGPSLLEADNPRNFPGTIVLYRRPLEEWCQSEEELRDQIRRTVFHEIAHRFGFSDAGMLAELRGEAGFSSRAEQAREVPRHWEQAQHDLAAAEVLLAQGFADWALEAARTAAYRALVAFLVENGEDREEVAGEGVSDLFARAVRHDRRFLPLKDLARLDHIATDMGDLEVDPPCRRVREKHARLAVEVVSALLRLMKGSGDGAMGKGIRGDQTDPHQRGHH